MSTSQSSKCCQINYFKVAKRNYQLELIVTPNMKLIGLGLDKVTFEKHDITKKYDLSECIGPCMYNFDLLWIKEEPQ